MAVPMSAVDSSESTADVSSGKLSRKPSSALEQARQKTDALFDLITPQALYSRAIPERHRLIFYIGHLEAFDWNLLCERLLGRASLNRRFEDLFAFGIDPVDGNNPCDAPAEWPALDEILAYREKARAAVDAALPACEKSSALAMAIEHRLMHLETLSYMLPHLPIDSFVAERIERERDQSGLESPDYFRTGFPGAVRVIDIPAGEVTLGRPRDGEAGFGWDNEYAQPLQPLHVPRFAIDARNVTNGEFLSFILAGGYDNRALWDDAAWQWRCEQGLTHPVLWSKKPRQKTDDYFLRTTFAVVPLPLDWPVSVSLAEARAYVRFRARTCPGARLPTEAEYHRAAYGTFDASHARAYPWGDAPPSPLVHGNFGCARYDFAPVGAFPAGDSAFEVADLIGNGWEWTETPFQPFSGFAIDPLYPGYSQPFFDGKHFVMKGASARTDVLFLRRSFRNWFQAHYPYVFATFRCAYDAGTR